MNVHFAFLAAVLLVGLAHVAIAVEDDGTKSVGQLWSEWKVESGRKYSSPAEEARRFSIFQSNKKLIDEHNAKFARGEVSYRMGLTAFADLTNAEFRQHHTGGIRMRERNMAVQKVGTKSADQGWAEWKVESGRKYSFAAEEARRFEIFQKNKELINEHNAKFANGEVSYKMGLNAFSDMTNDEFRQHHTGGIRMKQNRSLAVEDDGTASVGQLWSEWKVKTGRKYSSPVEEARRFAIFRGNKKLVDEHNAKFAKGEVSYKMGLNGFSDLTYAEFRQHHTGGIRMKHLRN